MLFFEDFVCKTNYIRYICIVFFMVLELRLTKIGCRDDNQFFFLPINPPRNAHPEISLRYKKEPHRNTM